MSKFLRHDTINHPVIKPFLDGVRWVVRILFRLLYRIRIEDAVNLPKEGPVLLVSNHVCWIDPLMLIAASRRRIRFVLVRRFYEMPFVNFWCRLEESIPIERKRPRTAIEKAIAKLEEGEVVCIFPEGGITQDGGIRPIIRGFEVIAKAANSPVVPVVICNLYQTALTIRRDWKKSDLTKAPWPSVKVVFDEVIPCEEVNSDLIEQRFKHILAERTSKPTGK